MPTSPRTRLANGRPHAGLPDANPPHTLTPSHLADLRASGLSEATIAASGFYSVHDPTAVQRLLNWRRSNGELGACLAIRYLDAVGRPTGYVRLKPDRPRVGRG